MPVVRVKPERVGLSPERRQELVGQLSQELAGQATEGGPVIFEIPLDQRDDVDVFVVWHAWEGVSWEDRSKVILEAYRNQAASIGIAQPLGVTYDEAIKQDLLPYRIGSLIMDNPRLLVKMKLPQREEREFVEGIQKAMLEAGAIALPDGKIDLRFPTQAMARNALARLKEAYPHYWSPNFSEPPVPEEP